MAEKGMPRVTVREVADRAGVQPALVNYYFGGKDGLLRAVVADVPSRTLARLAASAEQQGSAAQRLGAMLRAAVMGMAEAPYGPRLIMEQVLFGEEDVADEFAERFARRNLALVQQRLEEGRADGSLRDVDPMFLLPQLLGGVIFFFLAAPMLRRLFGIEEITPALVERFADHAIDVALHGIATNPRSAS
jgi:AcrR family transcriptional regulator